MSTARRAGYALIALALVGGIAVVGGQAFAGDETGPLGPGRVTIEIDVEHSTFTPDTIVVAPGTTVEFVLVNADPIDHEFIVGPTEVHDRHESGTERVHPPVPGEVSVAAFGSAGTFYVFDTPGTMVFACHLPGHYAYGMRGTVDVTSS